MDRTAWLYCEAKVAPAGSDWYYALLKASIEAKQACLALLTLVADWQAILTIDSHEPGVTELKWAWWDKELQQSFAGLASHPACRLLQGVPPTRFGLSLPLLMGLLANTRQDLYSYRFRDFAELQRTAFSHMDVNFILGLYVLTERQANLTTALHQLSFSLQLYQSLQRVRQNRGLYLFSEADLQKLALNPDRPDSWQTDRGFSAILKLYQDRADDLYEQALAVLTPVAALRPLLRYARLQHYVAHKSLTAGSSVRLSPIKKLLLTWFY